MREEVATDRGNLLDSGKAQARTFPAEFS